MGFITKFIFTMLFVVVVGSGVCVFLMIEDEAVVQGGGSLMGTEDLRQAKVFLENTDPRKLNPGEVSAITISEGDLELLINYTLDNFNGGRSQADFRQGVANVILTLNLPENPLGKYLNVSVTMSQWSNLLVLEDMELGSLHVPGWVGDSIMQFTHEQLKERVPEYIAILNAINGFDIKEQNLNIVYQWQPELFKQLSDRGREYLVSEEDRERYLAHARNLASVTQDPALPPVISLSALISPMFHFAMLRGGDPVEENRAAIVAMATYIMGVNISKLLGEPPETYPVYGKHKIILSERHDFAQHFLVSAGLSVAAGTGMADAIGLFKEMEDSQEGGSGFSFTDIGADRTGVKFAELAVSNSVNALMMQELLSPQPDESKFMAEFKDLPEFMPEAQFLQIYGGVGSPRYNDVVADIEARIARMPLFADR